MKINEIIENVKNMSQEDKKRLLKDAIKINNIIFVEFAMALGAAKGSIDYELFFLAIKGGYTEVVKIQIEAGLDVTIENNHAIFLASENGHIEIVDLLIKAGADLNAKNKYGDYPIYLACDRGHEKVVKRLIEAGIDVTTDNNRAICRASYHGYAKIVKLLIEAGVNATECSSAINFAIFGNYTETVEILVEGGANPANDYYINLSHAHRHNNKTIEMLIMKAKSN